MVPEMVHALQFQPVLPTLWVVAEHQIVPFQVLHLLQILEKRRRAAEHRPGAEDLAWADWIERQGWAVYYQPTAAVYHSHGEPFTRLLRRMAKDQPTIWGLKLGIIARRRAAHGVPAPAWRE